jgi:hypothetical protein
MDGMHTKVLRFSECMPKDEFFDRGQYSNIDHRRDAYSRKSRAMRGGGHGDACAAMHALVKGARVYA